MSDDSNDKPFGEGTFIPHDHKVFKAFIAVYPQANAVAPTVQSVANEISKRLGNGFAKLVALSPLETPPPPTQLEKDLEVIRKQISLEIRDCDPERAANWIGIYNALSSFKE